MLVSLAAPSPLSHPPASPLGAAISALDGMSGEERDRFYASLDQLPNFDSPRKAEGGNFGYTIDEEDWQWLSSAVGTKSPQELVQFAHDEAERMTLEDPELAELAQLGAATAEELGGDASLEEQLAGIQQLTRFAEHFEAGSPGAAGSGEASSSAAGEGKAKEKKPRERGTAWTEKEHKDFLIGLERFGKGDWRSISRQCVLTRTPAQVASHAQKYFIRQEAPIAPAKKANRRVSIHDISSLEQTMPARNQRKRRKAERAAAKEMATSGAPAAAEGSTGEAAATPSDSSTLLAAVTGTPAPHATAAATSAADPASPAFAEAAAAAAAAISAAASAPAAVAVPGGGAKEEASLLLGDAPSDSGGSAPGSAAGGSQPNSLPGSALSSPAKPEDEAASAAPAPAASAAAETA